MALWSHGRLLAELPIGEGMRHGRDLVPAVRDIIAAAGWTPQDISAIAVSAGPGSFTGLRIAATVARMMAWQNNAATLAVPTLQAMARQALPLAVRGGNSEIVVISDALRGGIYAARFAPAADNADATDRADDAGPAGLAGLAGPPAYIATETVGPAEEIADALPPDCLITGDGLKRFATLFSRWVQTPADLWHPTAAAIAEIGGWMLAKGRQVEPEKLEPIYVRRPSPEEVWQRRERGGR